MGNLVNPELLQPVVIQPPADIVMAPEIILEDIILRKRRNLLKLPLQKADVPGRHRIPGAGHSRHIVENVALRLLHAAEIGNDLRRLHNHFAEQKNARTYNLGNDPHHADDRVHLRQIAAVCPKFLPDIGNRIQAHDVDPAVCQIQHVGRHIVEDHAVAVIKVPLIGIESRHDDLLAFGKPGKIARRGRREYLRHRLLIFQRNGPVVIEEIAASGRLVALARQLCPDMILACMVHDEIEGNADPCLMAVVRQFFQILHGAQFRLHLTEIRYRVAAVIASLGTVQKRHQVQVVHAASFDVIQPAAHALQGIAEQVRVHHHAEKVIAFVPAGIGLPLPVQFLQGFTPLLIKTGHGRGQPVQCLIIFPVQGAVKPFQFVITLIKSFLKFFFPICLIHHIFYSGRHFCRFKSTIALNTFSCQQRIPQVASKLF